jgi:hypothetical protein
MAVLSKNQSYSLIYSSARNNQLSVTSLIPVMVIGWKLRFGGVGHQGTDLK